MKFGSTLIDGVLTVDMEKHVDERGFFARTWCAQAFAEAGLCERMVQASIAENKTIGTLRGLHYHAFEFPQSRLLRVERGAAYVVALDLRPSSESYLKHLSFGLSEKNARGLYTAPGIALGYQTLMDGTRIQYLMPEFYIPEHERGVRWNDSAFCIAWPDAPRVINERDANYPDYVVASKEG